MTAAKMAIREAVAANEPVTVRGKESRGCFIDFPQESQALMGVRLRFIVLVANRVGSGTLPVLALRS